MIAVPHKKRKTNCQNNINTSVRTRKNAPSPFRRDTRVIILKPYPTFTSNATSWPVKGSQKTLKSECDNEKQIDDEWETIRGWCSFTWIPALRYRYSYVYCVCILLTHSLGMRRDATITRTATYLLSFR